MEGRLRYVYVPDNSDAPLRSEVGGKALGLYRLRQIGCEVPPWFVVTASAWSVSAETAPPAAESGPDEIMPAPVVWEAIQAAMRQLGLGDDLLAVRSSARAEDGSACSFAGQFTSVLHVHPADLPRAIARVWASAQSLSCRAYAGHHGVPPDELAPAVVIQRMIIPDISGVLFTADPLTGERDTATIAALYGMGEGIVGGACNADSYRVHRSGTVLGREIASKTTCVRYDPAQHASTLVPVENPLRDRQVCSDAEIAELAELGHRISDALGEPQDIEWCLVGGRMYVLQTRPITPGAQARPPAEGEAVRIWDNANIVESFPGITLPLTFSFIDAMYAGVYRRLCLTFGLSHADLARQGVRFRMLGYHRGRVYYNLLNWHRILALLPGGERNCRHFDEMLGTEGRSEPRDSPPHTPGSFRTAWTVVRLCQRFLFLPFLVRRFLHDLEQVRAAADAVDLESLQLSELIGHYEHFEQLLLANWSTPQLNDFYCQTTTGLLRSAIARWLGHEQVAFVHELLPMNDTVESERAVQSLRSLAASIRERSDLVEACRDPVHGDLLGLLEKDPARGPRFDEHIGRFGDRWQEELKLETVTPRQEPEVLLGLLSNYVLAPAPDPSPVQATPLGDAVAALPLPKRWVIERLARLSRSLIANRENTRFERTRVFGLVRRVFRVVGQKLTERGHLGSADDVFYLTKEEVFAFIEGTGMDARLGPAVLARRRAIADWRTETPPGRFVSRGLLVEEVQRGKKDPAPVAGWTLTGTGASPGAVRARVKKVLHLSELGDARGCIIAAESTDPGWGFVFPLIAGILVERGSCLSHAAIVAREMRIPAVVAIDGLMERLPDGALVELDGSAGTVTVIEDAAGQESAHDLGHRPDGSKEQKVHFQPGA